uniref:Uncharacterized protein n=1 Tax=Panagrolaimus superbus TaxID=310955 RepID=A0A914Y864_9BILA
MNSEDVLNDLSTKIVNDVLPPEKESDLAMNKNSVVAEVEHDTDDISKKAQQTLENLKEQAGDIMNNLKDITNEVGSHENSPSHTVVEGLKSMAEQAQEKADEVSEWAKEKVEEVKSSFEQHPDAPKEEDNTIIGDLKEAAGKAQQKFEEVVVQSEKLINEHESSPEEENKSEHFKVERVLDSPLKTETGVPNAEADPYTTIKDQHDEVHFEKHGHEAHSSEISFVGKDSAEASSDIREHRPSPEDITADEKHGEHVELPVINDPIEGIAGNDENAPEVPAIDGRSVSPHGEHLIVGEDDHKFHDEEHTEETPVHESSESKEEVLLETYEEPSPQKETTPPVEIEIKDNAGENDITKVINPETTVAFDGAEGVSHDIHISDVVEQALHEQSPIQIHADEPLPPPDTEAPAPMIDNVPTQILIENTEVTHHIEDDEHEQPPSPPQLASREHSPQPKYDEVELERKKRSIEEYPKEPSPPFESDKEADAFAKDTVPVQIESQQVLPPLNVERESSPPALNEQSHTEILHDTSIASHHKESTPPPVPKITTKPPTPPSSPTAEDKADEEVIIPKIVAPETKEEKKTTVKETSTTYHHEPHHHVKPIDITPLPEDEPIPVGIPEVRTVETVKEEKEKTKKDQKGSTSSEDDKAAAPRRQEGGFVGNIRRRCCIL